MPGISYHSLLGTPQGLGFLFFWGGEVIIGGAYHSLPIIQCRIITIVVAKIGYSLSQLTYQYIVLFCCTDNTYMIVVAYHSSTKFSSNLTCWCNVLFRDWQAHGLAPLVFLQICSVSLIYSYFVYDMYNSTPICHANKCIQSNPIQSALILGGKQKATTDKTFFELKIFLGPTISVGPEIFMASKSFLGTKV